MDSYEDPKRRKARRREAPPAQPSLFDQPTPKGEAPILLNPERWGTTFDADMDALRLGTNTARVLALLLDGRVHTLDELRAVGGLQADRRARDLRSAGFGGMELIVSRNPAQPKGGFWFYRLVKPTPEQVLTARRALRGMGALGKPAPAVHIEVQTHPPRVWLEQVVVASWARAGLAPRSVVFDPVDPDEPVALEVGADITVGHFLKLLATVSAASAYVRRDADGLIRVSLVLPYGVDIGHVSIKESALAAAKTIWSHT